MKQINYYNTNFEKGLVNIHMRVFDNRIGDVVVLIMLIMQSPSEKK